MRCNYIDAKTFEEFKKNQEMMINIFNHSITDIKDDVKELKEEAKKTSSCISTINSNFSKFTGSYGILQKIVWSIFGIICTIVGAIIIATLSN